MSNVQDILNTSEDFAVESEARTNNPSAHLLVRVDALTRINVLMEGEVGQLRYRLFNILASQFRKTGSHQDGRIVYRIIHTEDLATYKATADANYRASYGGNVRSGEFDKSVDWDDSAAFPRIH